MLRRRFENEKPELEEPEMSGFKDIKQKIELKGTPRVATEAKRSHSDWIIPLTLTIISFITRMYDIGKSNQVVW